MENVLHPQVPEVPHVNKKGIITTTTNSHISLPINCIDALNVVDEKSNNEIDIDNDQMYTEHVSQPLTALRIFFTTPINYPQLYQSFR